MPKSKPASRAARRIQLQQDPKLLDEIIQRPLITAIVALDDDQIGKNVLALVMLDLKKALAKTASLHNRPTPTPTARAVVPAGCRSGVLAERSETKNGHTTTKFYGRPISWMSSFMQGGKLVRRINNPDAPNYPHYVRQ